MDGAIGFSSAWKGWPHLVATFPFGIWCFMFWIKDFNLVDESLSNCENWWLLFSETVELNYSHGTYVKICNCMAAGVNPNSNKCEVRCRGAMAFLTGDKFSILACWHSDRHMFACFVVASIYATGLDELKRRHRRRMLLCFSVGWCLKFCWFLSEKTSILQVSSESVPLAWVLFLSGICTFDIFRMFYALEPFWNVEVSGSLWFHLNFSGTIKAAMSIWEKNGTVNTS